MGAKESHHCRSPNLHHSIHNHRTLESTLIVQTLNSNIQPSTIPKTMAEQPQPVTLDQDEKLDSHHLAAYNPQVVLMSGAIGLLLLFIRIGPFSFILVMLVSLLTLLPYSDPNYYSTLSALPDFRSIVDSVLGTSLSPQRRLAENFPLLVLQSKSSSQANLESSTDYLHQPNQNIIKLDQLPDRLQSALGSLFDLIIQDYVESWYLLPNVSTGDRAFLNQLRNALNHILLNAHAKLITKSSKETMIYLIGCLSMNLVRELNDRADTKSQTSYQDRIAQRLTQTRRISEEILLTLGSSSITSSPLTLNLASEILTVQLISFTSSFNQDWFNTTLIDSLGTTTPTQVSLATTSTKPGTAAAVVHQIKENTKQNDAQSSLFQTPSPARPHSTHDTPSTMPATSDEINSLTGSDVLMAYLKSPANFTLAISTKSNSIVRLQDLFDRTSKWAPKNVFTDSERSSLLSTSSDDSVQVECLVKLFNHFESFHKACHSANLKPDIIKVDAVSILSALAPLMDYSLDQLISSQPDQNSKHRLSSSWKLVIIETLRRLECVSAAGSPIFGNLQEWLLDCLRSIKSYPSSRASSTSRLETRADINYQPWATPETEATRGDNVRYMTLPNIPAAGPSGYTVDSPPTQSHDLASSSDDRAWDKAKNSTTEAVLSRHRTPSHGRAPVSPASGGFGASPRRGSEHENFGSSPIAALHSSTFGHSSSISARVPEEGDMTEGYSMDETSENEGSEPKQSILLINASRNLNASTPSSRFDDTNTTSSPASKSKAMSLPPVSSNSQPAAASFSVSVTDMSPPSATDSKTGLIKHKKDISLLIAVEAPFVPGFIVTRGWPEIERMDLAINKKKLVGVGTKDFPRALLPTNLNLKTIDHVRRELEAYLRCLLNDERYSKSEPVLKFFAKERSGMNGSAGAINNIFNTTSSTLDSIGKGVASVGKEVVSKPVDFATSGLNRLSKGVFSGLPFGNSPASTRLEEHDEPTFIETANPRESLQLADSSNSNLLVSEPLSITKESEDSVSTANSKRVHEKIGDGNGQSVDHDGRTKSKEKITREHSSITQRSLQSTSGPAPTSTDPSAVQTQDEKNPPPNVLGPDAESATHAQPPVSIGGAVSSVTESVKLATTTPGKNTRSTAAPDGASTTLPTCSTTAATTLSNKEFDTVIIGIISILEAAYGLDQRQGGSGSNTPWSMKRGVLRVLETILRTTSFSDFIRLTLSQLIDKFEKVETYVDLINSALLSLSSPASPPHDDEQSFKNKRKPHRQTSLYSLMSDDESLDGLTLDMPSSSSSSSSADSAAPPSRHYKYQASDDQEEQKSQKADLQAKLHRATQLKTQRQLTARRLFTEAWSNLKIGLGSNGQPPLLSISSKERKRKRKLTLDRFLSFCFCVFGLSWWIIATDVAATKVFDLFQEFIPPSHQHASPFNNKSDTTQDEDDSHVLSPAHLPSGIEFIVHSLLLDLIRIILLL
ncbi:uncharacterized protein VP01_1222g3 [Puccinia sorghi]|uniref:PXA domain-containing protein n=1 Tax=Puccinia sorghi TaxID=27349 RepID=A0A0L6VRH9_9BASI|nr:uncharacterized protein VP01_1222g3 [Puccinia sorghi]